MTQLSKHSLSTVQFEGLEEAISDMNNSRKQLRSLMNLLARSHAFVALGEAQRKSLGPLDPKQSGVRLTGHSFIGNSQGMVRRQPHYAPTAWKIPVRRITGNYFHGWEVERKAQGVWRLQNKTREAYFIEFGINHKHTGAIDSAGQRVRIRRPILKLSVLAAIKFIDSSHFDSSALGQLLTGRYGHSSHTGSYGFPMGAARPMGGANGAGALNQAVSRFR